MGKVVVTDRDAPDPRLRGRAYGLPFAAVWEAALEVARSRARWTVLEADPRAGRITAEARTLVWKFVDDVVVCVTLDERGLTRVDVRSASRVGRGDFGTNARRIARYLHALDRKLMRGGSSRVPPA